MNHWEKDVLFRVFHQESDIRINFHYWESNNRFHANW
jgi:hypothetical protein